MSTAFVSFIISQKKGTLKNGFYSLLFVLKIQPVIHEQHQSLTACSVLSIGKKGIVRGKDTGGYSRRKMFSHNSSLFCKQDTVMHSHTTSCFSVSLPTEEKVFRGSLAKVTKASLLQRQELDTDSHQMRCTHSSTVVRAPGYLPDMHIDLAKTSLSILPAAGFFLQLVWFYWQTCLIPSSSRYCWCYPFSWKSLEKLCLVLLALQETFQLIYQSCCKMNYATAVFLLEKWHRQILSQDSLNSCFTRSLECLSSGSTSQLWISCLLFSFLVTKNIW